MAQELADRRDLDFVIWEQLNGEEHLKHPLFKEFNRKTCDMIINEARSLAIKEVLPTLAEGDTIGVHYENNTVKLPECFKRPFELMKEGEWGNLQVPSEMHGQGAPPFVATAAIEYFMAANWALFSYLAMGCSTAGMIQHFGTQEQIDQYVPKLVSADWGGTMLLTEPQAGTDVGAIETIATQNDDGTYNITGNKIFITNGEHDLADNIIHPVLARIEGSPAGTKGISIFIVPKFMINDDGSLGERNDILCTGTEEKMGIHGSATCSMTMGSKGKCTGFLLGEVNKGMKIMFNMMNEARMATGLQALSYASASYLLAVNYARERLQGRDIENFFDAAAPSVPIIKHPDVRRNLLWMKSYLDGMRSFFYYATIVGTRSITADTEEERKKWTDMFELLTPLAKDYLANHGHDICVQSQQVHGGVGYCKDFLPEQYTRDIKITSIFEGCSGVQAMDLLARKMPMDKGKVFMIFLGEITDIINQAKEIESLKDIAAKTENLVKRLGEVAMHLGNKAMAGEIKLAFAYSHPYLEVMGDTIMAWMLLWRAVVAAPKIEGAKKKDQAFYQGQVKTAEFFINVVVPATIGKIEGILAMHPAAIDIPDDGFGGI
ncbi:MAG: acyl-CoA dehydrogenase [Proteobacteria bacterium]|nr:acyl-CoA dehydrogenase [Pseudomonadota bacterium]